MRDGIKTKRQLIEELADLRRRVAELEASEAEARWRSLVEVAPDPMVTADLKGVITLVQWAGSDEHRIFQGTDHRQPLFGAGISLGKGRS